MLDRSATILIVTVAAVGWLGLILALTSSPLMGVAMSCGLLIAKERLKAVLTATLCVPCKTEKGGR